MLLRVSFDTTFCLSLQPSVVYHASSRPPQTSTSHAKRHYMFEGDDSSTKDEDALEELCDPSFDISESIDDDDNDVPFVEVFHQSRQSTNKTPKV